MFTRLNMWLKSHAIHTGLLLVGFICGLLWQGLVVGVILAVVAPLLPCLARQIPVVISRLTGASLGLLRRFFDWTRRLNFIAIAIIAWWTYTIFFTEGSQVPLCLIATACYWLYRKRTEGTNNNNNNNN